MTQTSINYATVLYELGIKKEVVGDCREIFSQTPELLKNLASPVVSTKTKAVIIGKVFPKEVQNFFKVLCDYNSIELIDEIFTAYRDYCNEQEHVLRAKLTYVNAPQKEQREQIEAFLKKRFSKERVELECEKDESLIGGFVINAENIEFDQSLRGKIKQLQQKLVQR